MFARGGGLFVIAYRKEKGACGLIRTLSDRALVSSCSTILFYLCVVASESSCVGVMDGGEFCRCSFLSVISVS